MSEYVRLGDVCEIQSGGTPSRSIPDYWNGGTIPWVKISDFDGKYLNNTQEFITQKGLENSSAKMFYKGTILYTIFATLGETCILNIDAATNQAIAGIKIIDDRIKNDYLYNFLISKKSFINNIGRGVAQNNINLKILKALEISILTIEEQKQIANTLDKVTALIDKHKKQLEKLDELVKARFVEMFGDVTNNDKNWHIEPLGNLCDISRGGSPRPIEQYLGGTIPWIKIGDATDGDDIYLTKTKEKILEIGIKKSRLVKSGSLIFANCGVSLGFARIITFDGCIHDGWLSFENIDENLDKIFLLKSLNCMTEYFRSIAPSGTQPNLNTAIMKSYKQIVPPIELQNQFADFVKQVEKTKTEVQKSLEQAETLKKALMQKYFV